VEERDRTMEKQFISFKITPKKAQYLFKYFSLRDNNITHLEASEISLRVPKKSSGHRVREERARSTVKGIFGKLKKDHHSEDHLPSIKALMCLK
jgi:hypothetical protein